VQDISVVKELRSPGTPLFLFECVLPSGVEFYWSTHAPTVGGQVYEARVLSHSPIEYRCGGGEAAPFVPTVTLTLANADHALSTLMMSQQWKGSRIRIRFVVYDLDLAVQASNAIEILQGVVSAADDADHETIRLTIANRAGTSRAQLPARRIQRRCAWLFPRTVEERQAAAEGGRYSPFHGCGYSPDVVGGVGNTSNGDVFVECSYTKDACAERGMFDLDSMGRPTKRFSGFEYVPLSKIVRGYGEQRREAQPVVSPEDASGAVIPIVYGTAWTEAILVLAQSDGNLLRGEAVLCEGPIAGVIKVVVNGVELASGVAGADMTGTGWYNVISLGGRTGAFNEEFFGGATVGGGDPNAGLARISIAIPEAEGSGSRIRKIQVLVQGAVLPIYQPTGAYAGESYTSNPAWVLLDLLRRSGYKETELDIASFAGSAAICGSTVSTVDRQGRTFLEPLADCNLLLRTPTPVGEVLSAVQAGAGLLLRVGRDGRIECIHESPISVQQPVAPPGSNAVEALQGGWPAYEFGDGTGGFGGIALSASREPSLRVYSRSHSDSSNQVTVDFLDPHNEYVSDTFTLTDVDDVIQVGQEVKSRLFAAGVTGEAQAHRLCRRFLDRKLRGNLYAEFQTSIKAALLRPGDLITLSIASAGLTRQLFRVLSVAPGFNGERVGIVAQWHEDSWYEVDGLMVVNPLSAQVEMESGEPRPLLGDEVEGASGFRHSVQEQAVDLSDGTQLVQLAIGFTEPKADGVTLHGRPSVARVASIVPGGGTWAGPKTLYYAISTEDGAGVETVISATAHAVIPMGVSGAGVRVSGIRAGGGAVSMNVYRGGDPWQLRRIATGVPVSGEFTDAGLTELLAGPPDVHYRKAVSEWRSEYLPPMPVSLGDATTVTVADAVLAPDALKGKTVRVQSGTGSGQERLISGNSAGVITLASSWHTIPDATSSVCIVESGWQVGGNSRTSPCALGVPAQEGAAVHLRVFGVNSRGGQSRKDLAKITRHVVGSGGSTGLDVAVPPAPTFGLTVRDGGYAVAGGIGFPTLENTSSISAGVLQLFYLDEVDGVTVGVLSAAIDSEDEALTFEGPVSVEVGQVLMVGGELVRCTQTTSAQTTVPVERGVLGGASVSHAVGIPVRRIEQVTQTFAVPRGFFGSVGSGDFEHAVAMSSSRVVAATLAFLNRKGFSEAGVVNLTSLAGQGLRVLQGGQIVLQVSGYLIIQTSATPPVVVEHARSIREVFAVVDEAPLGTPLVLRVRRNAETLCELTIAPEANVSNVVSGLVLPALAPMDRIALDVVSLGVGEGTFPGRNLTVSIRL